MKAIRSLGYEGREAILERIRERQKAIGKIDFGPQHGSRDARLKASMIVVDTNVMVGLLVDEQVTSKASQLLAFDHE